LATTRRRTPAELPLPLHGIHRVEVTGIAGGLAALPEQVIEEDFAYYSLTSGSLPAGLWAEWTLRTLKPEVAATSAPAVFAASRKIGATSAQRLDLTGWEKGGS
jgi:hypothetical protein